MSSKETATRRRMERLASGDLCSEQGCPNARVTRGLCKTHYNRAGGYGPKNTEHSKARQRAKTHLRKAVGRYTDVTPEYERALRDKAKRCPLCKVTLIKEPYLPASKELDHMVPLNVGGTHTIGNVRIICRTCNVRRPKDGSDYVGPVTLWAQEPGFAPTTLRPRRSKPAQACECGSEKRNGRCYACQPVPTRELDGKRAAELRAEGWAWRDIADELGFLLGNVATRARKWGDPEVVAHWHVEVACCLSCEAKLPQGGRGRPRQYCVQCRPPQGASTPRPWPPPWLTPQVPSHTPPTLPMVVTCVDCGDPVTRGRRCAECWTEVSESDAA